MKCTLCEKDIDGYDASFNHLVIDETRAVDVCNACIDKFMAWRGKVLATLFPTNTMKKRYGKRK